MDIHILQSLYKSCILTNTPKNTQKDIHKNLTVYITHNIPEYFENTPKWVGIKDHTWVDQNTLASIQSLI